MTDDKIGVRRRALTPLTLMLAWALSTSAARGAEPLPEAASPTIGYATVAEALSAVRQMPGVTFANVRGWMIATDLAARTVWSFAPEGDPSYPAVVKRSVTPRGAQSTVHMSIHCEASKAACDDLYCTFNEMNQALVGRDPKCLTRNIPKPKA